MVKLRSNKISYLKKSIPGYCWRLRYFGQLLDAPQQNQNRLRLSPRGKTPIEKPEQETKNEIETLFNIFEHVQRTTSIPFPKR